jgi:hypothetical protein
MLHVRIALPAVTQHEIIVAHRSPITRATHVRSTLIQSSVNTLRNLGHFERYTAHLDPAHAEAVLQTLAPSWMPIEVAEAHYAACDALRLAPSDLLSIGEAVGDRIQGTFLTTLSRGARAAGITPWTLFVHFDRLWGRLYQGGSAELRKAGPKDALIEVRSAVLPRFAYFRAAFCGVVRAPFKLVGVRMVHVKVERWNATTDTFVMRAAWV